MKVYILTTYAPSTYSYDGIEPDEIHIHATEQGAINHAAKLGYVVRPYCKNEHLEATIDETELLT